MEVFKDLPILLFESQPDWHNWLEEHQNEQSGVWLKHARKGSGKTTVSYAEALEEALCYGWIDGQKQKYDDDYYLQQFTPRRPKSLWSKVNVTKAEALIKAGRMQPAGLKAIELAKTDGRWDAAYAPASANHIPADFQAALDHNPKAKQFFQTLNKANVYAICWRIQTAKKPETRRARVEQFIQMLARGEKLH